MSAHWYPLGLQLQVRTSTLDGIRVQFQNPRDQLLEMLKTWLTTSGNTCWKTLTDALRSRSVGASQLASVLERKHCRMEETAADSGTSENQPETNVPPPSTVPEQVLPTPQPLMVDTREGIGREGHLAKLTLQNFKLHEFSISPGTFPLISSSTPLETSPHSHPLTIPPSTPEYTGMPCML